MSTKPITEAFAAVDREAWDMSPEFNAAVKLLREKLSTKLEEEKLMDVVRIKGECGTMICDVLVEPSQTIICRFKNGDSCHLAGGDSISLPVRVL